MSVNRMRKKLKYFCEKEFQSYSDLHLENFLKKKRFLNNARFISCFIQKHQIVSWLSVLVTTSQLDNLTMANTMFNFFHICTIYINSYEVKVYVTVHYLILLYDEFFRLTCNNDRRVHSKEYSQVKLNNFSETSKTLLTL